eukprot:s2239_g7.t1
MNRKLQSRAWSCSELVRGAAQIVDEMPAPSLNDMVVDQMVNLLGETSDLTAAELEKLLQDRPEESNAAPSAAPVATPVRSDALPPAGPPAMMAAKVSGPGGVEQINIADSESEGESEKENPDLLHAKTLRLDDVSTPAPEIEKVAGPVDEARAWKDKYEELQRKFALLELEKSSTVPATPTPKQLFSPSPSPASTGLAAVELPLPPVKAHVSLPAPPPPQQVPPKVAAVPKQGLAPCPAKAAPATVSSEAVSKASGAAPAPSAAPDQIQEGEEALAEQLDLSDEEGYC